MPIFYVPDNTPSRNYGRNSRTEGFAHPAHGTIGGLAKSDTDPRNRGRQRSRDEIEAASRARYDAKQERLAKLREGVAAQQSADKEAKASKRLRVTADKSAAALAASPEAARREVARQQTAEAAAAKKGQPLKRLTPEEIAANEKAINAREAAARASAQAESKTRAGMMDKLMSERMKSEGPSLSETLAASEAAGKPFIERPRSSYTPPVTTPAAAEKPADSKPALVSVSVPTPVAAPNTFLTRSEMLEAAMNPSGAKTPLTRMQGLNTPLVDKYIAAMNPEYGGRTITWAEEQHPNWKQEDLMGPVQRQAVKDQNDKLEFQASLFSPTASSDWRGTNDVGDEFLKDERRRNMYATPDYLPNRFAQYNEKDKRNLLSAAEASGRNLSEQQATSRDMSALDRTFNSPAVPSNQLISQAFTGPAAGTASPSALFAETQGDKLAAQRHTLGADFHGGLPNRAVTLAGETVGDVMNELEVPESFKQSLRFRPGMEFGEPRSRPTAIGANATGIGAGRPEKKKEKFADWLRSNFPDSFSDPNSMYYFPGKFD